jgi:hypothetical protein
VTVTRVMLTMKRRVVAMNQLMDKNKCQRRLGERGVRTVEGSRARGDGSRYLLLTRKDPGGNQAIDDGKLPGGRRN